MGHRCLIRILSLVLSKYIFNSLKIESLIVTLSNVHILDRRLLNEVLFALSMVTLLFGIKNFPITLFN